MTLQVAPTQNATSNSHTSGHHVQKLQNNGEPSSPLFPESRQASWPDDQPLPEEADSHLLIIRVDGMPEYQPDSPYCDALPYRLPPMRRETAEMMAAKLNRDLIEEAQNRRVWWVVVYKSQGPKGFSVVRVPVPRYKIWRPESEYDLPPGIVGPDLNCNVRRNRTDFNRQQLHRRDEWGVKLLEWALHIKPIRKPENNSEPSSQLNLSEPGSDRSCAKNNWDTMSDLNRQIPAAGHQIVQAIKDSLRFAEVTSNHLGETVVNHSLVRIVPALRDESAQDYIGKHTSQIRGLAAKLLDIANQLDGVEQTPLTPMRQIATELGVDGCDEVSILVYNSQTDQEAISKARQALALMNR